MRVSISSNPKLIKAYEKDYKPTVNKKSRTYLLRSILN